MVNCVGSVTSKHHISTHLINIIMEHAALQLPIVLGNQFILSIIFIVPHLLFKHSKIWLKKSTMMGMWFCDNVPSYVKINKTSFFIITPN